MSWSPSSASGDHRDASLYTLTQVFSVAIFEKVAIKTAFSPDVYGFDGNVEVKQLKLFSF
jgi:hypothetical protein